MIDTSHQVALPIHRFCPLSTQASPSRFEVVVRPPLVPDQTRGSVRPKQPIFSQRAIGGSHFCFCSSEPPREIEPIPKPLCTPKNVAIHRVSRAISMATKPNICALPPLQP